MNTTRPQFITRAISLTQQRELCLRCPLAACDAESKACLIRRRVNELLRIRYWKDPEKSRASRRKAATPPSQYEKKRAYMVRYYRENRDVILMKQQHKKNLPPKSENT